MRPRRKVTATPEGYTVDGFTTLDLSLARDVAAEMDRLDPLPCTSDHDESDITEIMTWEGMVIRRVYSCCGESE